MTAQPVALPRPPRGVSPESFFTDYIPALARGVSADWPALATPIELGIELLGGPSFVLTFSGPLLAVSQAPPTALPLRLRTTMADWREQVDHILPTVLRYTEKNMDRTRQSVVAFLCGAGRGLDLSCLTSLPGELEVIVADDAGDSTKTYLVVGSGRGPRASIAVGLNDIWRLLEKGGRFSTLLSTRARVEGDLPYVLRLAACLGLS